MNQARFTSTVKRITDYVRKSSRTLRFRLAVLIMIMAWVPLISLSAYQVKQFMDETDRSIHEHQLDIARSNATVMNNWLKDKIAGTQEFIKNHPEVADQPIAAASSTAIQSIKQTDPEIQTTYASTAAGLIPSTNGNLDITKRDYFIKAKESKNPAISDVLWIEATKSQNITIAVPLFNTKKEFTGIIGNLLILDALKSTLGEIKVGETGYGFMLSGSGTFIYHPDASMVGQNYDKVLEGTSVKTVISEEILVKDEGFIRYTDDHGIRKMASFSTVPLTGWKVVVTVPGDEVFGAVDKAIHTSVILIVVVSLMLILLSAMLAAYIARPVTRVAQHVNILAQADFTAELHPLLLKRKDEIGNLARSVKTMSASMSQLVHQVVEESNNVRANMAVSSDNLSALGAQVEEVSATTEQMSAGMEETAAMTQEMNATSKEIEMAITSISSKAQEGSDRAEEISRRALQMKEGAVQSRNSAEEIRAVIESESRQAIEQAAAVKEIDTLTNSILEITNQTNLLALNAAIEAARAGESGRGFAVVAGEIRKLAENSRVTASKIQDVTKQVVSSVEDLTESSEKALRFLETTVIRDYNTLVETGQQYYRDSETIQELVTDFSSTAEELLASTQNLLQAIQEVTLSNQEGAESTQDIAEKSSGVMKQSVRVKELMHETESTVTRLLTAVSRFKV
ncbi:methyl-accepting chemotaxis protein [Gorillibacterium sp. sgz5001074]|uniref:methyl-accepting chemotaxis protein n=1 Tax=Gorillibacterium sp. sgz5001074 TaxID=3446695 RepID=UPI003F6619EF